MARFICKKTRYLFALMALTYLSLLAITSVWLTYVHVPQKIESSKQFGTLQAKTMWVYILPNLNMRLFAKNVDYKHMETSKHFTANKVSIGFSGIDFMRYRKVLTAIKIITLDNLSFIDQNQQLIDITTLEILPKNADKFTAKAIGECLGQQFNIESTSTINVQQGIIHANDIKITYADNVILGDCKYSWLNHNFAGNLYSDSLKLTLPVNNEAQQQQSSKDINLQWLTRVNGGLNIIVNNLSINAVKLQDLRLNNSLAQGVLDSKLTVNTLTGKLQGYMQLHATQPDFMLKTKLIGSDLSLQSLLLQLGRNNLEGGNFTFEFQAKSQGKNVNEHLQAMQGFVTANIGNAAYIDKQKIQSKCAATTLFIKEGRAISKEGIAIETDNFSGIASGEINLTDLALNLQFKPDMYGLGFSELSLDDIVAIQGNLFAPKINVNVGKTIEKTGKITAALLSSGITAIGNAVINSLSQNKISACEKVNNIVKPQVF